MFHSHNLSRRDLFKLSLAGSLTASVPWFDALRAHAESEKKAAAKQCILLWLGGGPSQAHSWDPKKGEHVNLIDTNVPGLQFSEYLPKLAQRMDRLALLKTMSHGNFGHGDAVILMTTSYKNKEGGVERPSLGSMVSHSLGKPDAELPNYVVLDPNQSEGAFSIGAGHLGPQYAPLKVLPGQAIPDLAPTGGLTGKDIESRAALLERMNREFIEHNHSNVATGHQNSLAQALKIMKTPKTKAFNLDEEPAKVQDTYGKDKMGRACLLARRLIEAGVPFVSTHLRDGKGNGWDTHMDAPNRNKELFQNLDVSFSALLDDLKERGLLDTTLVVCMGEFGRSRNGVEHNNRIWTAVLAGGGIKPGQAIGNSGADGKTMTGYRPVRPGDLFATILKVMGVKYKGDYMLRGGRPVSIVDPKAQPVDELF